MSRGKILSRKPVLVYFYQILPESFNVTCHGHLFLMRGIHFLQNSKLFTGFFAHHQKQERLQARIGAVRAERL